jgi:hypothetical protein
MSTQIIILGSVTQADSSFYVTGVFWLTANANNIVPQPTFKSQVPNVAVSDLASLRSGSIVEQAFNSGAFVSGTTLSTVQSSLQTQFTAAQTTLSNQNPPLSGLIESAYNGSSWASYTTGSSNSLSGNLIASAAAIEFPFLAAFGFIPNITIGRATGYVATSATSGVAIRATTYAPQGVNAQRSFKSSSANDSAAGSGAQTITVNYLNTSFQLKQDTITLNGTTAVNSNQTDIAFVESLVVATVGTQGGGNAGTISMYTSTSGGGTVWASIAPSDNMTYWAAHYVPTGVTCYILGISGGATAAAGSVTINHSGNPLTTDLPQLGIGGTYPHLSAGNEDHEFSIPIAVPGPDLIWLVERPGASTASTAYGTFEYCQF